MASRQQDVGEDGRIVHGHLLNNQEVDLAEHLLRLVLLGLVGNDVGARAVQGLKRERLADELLVMHDVVHRSPVEVAAGTHGLFALVARLVDAAGCIADAEVAAARTKAGAFLAEIAGKKHEGSDPGSCTW